MLALSRSDATTQIWLQSLNHRRIWLHLGWRDIRSRYALTALGPWWTTVTVLLFSISLGVVYAGLFGVPLSQYLPYVTSGLVSWYLVSGVISESTSLSSFYKSLLLNTSITVASLALATTWRNVIIFVQSAPIALAVTLIGAGHLTWSILLLIPGLFVASMVFVPGAYLLSAVGNRFPGFVTLIPTLLLLAFLTTPIFWDPEITGDRTWIYQYNPLYWLVTVVRQPLLSQVPSWEAWLIVCGFGFALWLVALNRTRLIETSVSLRL